MQAGCVRVKKKKKKPLFPRCPSLSNGKTLKSYEQDLLTHRPNVTAEGALETAYERATSESGVFAQSRERMRPSFPYIVVMFGPGECVEQKTTELFPPVQLRPVNADSSLSRAGETHLSSARCASGSPESGAPHLEHVPRCQSRPGYGVRRRDPAI
ncbi:hypothetical protein LY76DRAFT_194014 [Colletotrichum caudatum]|nr:hypothetical protein LY76DRAFT_194014 [Colletotrichum caudatum]